MARSTQRFSVQRLMLQLILGSAIAVPAVMTSNVDAAPPSRRYPAKQTTPRQASSKAEKQTQREPEKKTQRAVEQRTQRAPEKQTRQQPEQRSERQPERRASQGSVQQFRGEAERGSRQEPEHSNGRGPGYSSHREPLRRDRNEINIHVEFDRGRRYCPPPRRPVYVERVYRVEHVSYPTHRYEPVCEPFFYGLDSRGWDDLRCGRYVVAKQRFRDEIEWNSHAPVLEIGYSVATGRIEHFTESIRSMRRAVNLDADALLAVREHCDLRYEAECLLDQYLELIRCDSRDVDALFMAASIESILGHWQAANNLIAKAIYHGDCSASTRALQCFIEKQLRC